MQDKSEKYVLIIANGMPSDNCLGGIFEMDQAKALHRQGMRVVFLALDLRSIRHRRTFGIKKCFIDDITCYHASFPLGNVPLCLFKLFGMSMLKKAYKRIVCENGEPKVIHAHFTDMGYLVGLMKKRFDIKLILTEHSSAVNKPDMNKKTWKMAKIAYSAADVLIAVSTALKENMRRVQEREIAVIPNIVDISNFLPDKPRMLHSDYRFVSVGGLNEIKNYEVLIRAFALAFLNNTNVTMNIVGDGIEYSALNNIIKKLGMEDRIRLLGRKNRQEIAKLFYESDAFVLLSKSETFGVSFIEAMACGLPVISSRCGGPEDFVNEKNGILVPVDDIVASAKALVDIQNKEFDRDAIQNYVITHFSDSVITQKLIDVYETIGKSYESSVY